MIEFDGNPAFTERRQESIAGRSGVDGKAIRTGDLPGVLDGRAEQFEELFTPAPELGGLVETLLAGRSEADSFQPARRAEKLSGRLQKKVGEAGLEIPGQCRSRAGLQIEQDPFLIHW